VETGIGGASVGIVLTFLTYFIAENNGGGAQGVCTGAIIFGILNLLGLIGWLQNQGA
jgi:hypothetical protein